MGNNMSLGYDGEDEQEQQEQQEQEQQEEQEEQEEQKQQEQQKQEHLNKKNDNIKKSSIKNKESTNASVSESVSESIHAQATASKIKKRKQTVRNLKASKKVGKTKSNKRILKEYQSRYLNGEKEREQRATSTLLNSD